MNLGLPDLSCGDSSFEATLYRDRIKVVIFGDAIRLTGYGLGSEDMTWRWVIGLSWGRRETSFGVVW